MPLPAEYHRAAMSVWVGYHASLVVVWSAWVSRRWVVVVRCRRGGGVRCVARWRARVFVWWASVSSSPADMLTSSSSLITSRTF